MKQLFYFLLGTLALRLLDYILVIFAEQESDWVLGCAAFLPEYGEAYQWN